MALGFKGACIGTRCSNTGKVEVTATCFETKSLISVSASGLSGVIFSSVGVPVPSEHLSGCLPGSSWVLTKKPCSRSSMPNSAASG